MPEQVIWPAQVACSVLDTGRMFWHECPAFACSIPTVASRRVHSQRDTPARAAKRDD
jgi:hypothetical protein